MSNSISFLDESCHPEHSVPDVAEVPPFERPPFPGAHGVGRRPHSPDPPPSIHDNVRRQQHGAPLRVVGTAAIVVLVGRPGARKAPPLPGRRHVYRGRLLRPRRRRPSGKKKNRGDAACRVTVVGGVSRSRPEDVGLLEFLKVVHGLPGRPCVREGKSSVAMARGRFIVDCIAYCVVCAVEGRRGERAGVSW